MTLAGLALRNAFLRNRTRAILTVLGTIVLIRVVGTEPMHPGTMIVLALSVLAYAVASYVVHEGTGALVVIGVMVGLLAMMKINVGVLAAAGGLATEAG